MERVGGQECAVLGALVMPFAPLEQVKPTEGYTVGRLTAKEFVELNKQQLAMWLCECKCGGTKIVSGSDTTRCRGHHQ